jgi:hypothetical protein
LPISSIRGIAIQPTKAKTATLDSWGTGNSQVNNTWYTIVNVTSGTGLLSRVMASIFNGTTYVSNVNTQIKITVDGVSETLSNGFNALIGANALRGSEHNMGQTTTGYALSCIFLFKFKGRSFGNNPNWFLYRGICGLCDRISEV